MMSAGWPQSDYAVPKDEVAGFGIFDEELGSIVENPTTSTINGLTTDSDGEELGSIVENFSIDGLTTNSDGEEFASTVENPSIDGLSTGSDGEEFGSIVENPSIDGLTSDSDGEELGSIDSDLLDRRQENFCIYFRDALTAVLLACALKGSFTRANNLLSSLKGLSVEGACIPDPTWEWTPHVCDQPSCEMNKTYIGYMIYFFMVKWALLGEN